MVQHYDRHRVEPEFLRRGEAPGASPFRILSRDPSPSAAPPDEERPTLSTFAAGKDRWSVITPESGR